MRVRHPHLEGRVDADEADTLRSSKPLGDLLRRPIAAPLDRGHRTDLARVRHVVREPDEQRRFAVARQHEVTMMQVEVVRKPEDVRLVVTVDA